MAKKINFIKLIKLDKEGNPIEDKNGNFELETFFTPNFIPFRKVYEATELLEEAEGKEEVDRDGKQEMALMLEFICDIYQNKFTPEDLLDRLHAPNASEEISEQINFIAQGAMSDARKKELARMI